ncbi:diguanylate cyclase domain-containing protein [Aestuariispira insulae]|uniref:Two-component system cell cycle response regulator n=1 Tax=Aestuariispira insulae TaxID=1461337 RepID=A0A3D9HNK5_9PROT|nr:diguanylate cyclase [Aestuariispira insulae]RED51074.1 two-component system cell cycle response regulator [Aestuariispira insulae]
MAHSKARILVADGGKANATALSGILSGEGYHVTVVADDEDLKTGIERSRPDVILIGPLADDDPVNAASALREVGINAPVLLYGGDGSQHLYDQAKKAGVDDVMEGIPTKEMLLARLPHLVRLSTLQAEMFRRLETSREFGLEVREDQFDRFGDKPFQVMYICASQDPEIDSADISRALIDAGLSVRQESNVYHAGNRLGDERFEACVVRINIKEDLETSLYLCSQVRDNPRLFSLPVLIAADAGLIADEKAFYDAGATLVLPGGLQPTKIARHVEILVARQRFKWNLRDPLLATLTDATGNPREGTYSEAFFEKHLERVLTAAKTQKTELSVSVFSIRNFHEVQSRYGEEAARILMRQMASWIKGLLRIEDVTARLSDAEFGVVLPDTSLDDARSVANRIVGILHHSDFRLTDEIMEAVQVSVSLGVAAYEPTDQGQDLLARAKSQII